MVTLGDVRCSYCGGCVSVCPVGAIAVESMAGPAIVAAPLVARYGVVVDAGK